MALRKSFAFPSPERVARTTGFVVRVLCVAIIVTVSFSEGASNQSRAADRNRGGLRYLLVNSQEWLFHG